MKLYNEKEVIEYEKANNYDSNCFSNIINDTNIL